MYKINKIALIIFFLIFFIKGFSQTKEILKQQKEALEKEIKYTNSLLEKTKKNKTKSLTYLTVLNTQIKNKEKYISILSLEIGFLQSQIRKVENKINGFDENIKKQEKEIILLTEEYAKMIYFANRNKANQNPIIFIISAKDFNQAYKRALFLKQYTSSRKNQIKKITEAKNALKNEKEEKKKTIKKLNNEEKQKERIVLEKKSEATKLALQKEEKNLLLKRLTNSEKIFQQQLQDQRKTAKDLDDKIRKIIEEEIKKARELAKKEAGTNEYKLTPENIELSNKFATNKGKLPWPLEKGVITQPYGKQKHKEFSNVETFNNGIDIATEKDAIIRSVFDGKVSRIFFIKGEGKAVLVNHGEYFTVYSGLKEVLVSAGDNVLTGEEIAVVSTIEKDQKTELHFEIWKGYEKQDPAKWLLSTY